MIFHIYAWIAFWNSVSPGIGSGFWNILVSFVFGYILMCFSSWLSVLFLYHIPLYFFSDQTKLAQIVFGNLYMIFAVVFLVGWLFFDGYTKGTNNQTTAGLGFTYTFDDEGNRLTRTETSTGNAQSYEWDYRNRLLRSDFLQK